MPGEHKPPSTRPGLCSSLFYRLTSFLSIVSLLCGYTAASPSAPAIAFHLKNAENKTVKLSAFFLLFSVVGGESLMNDIVERVCCLAERMDMKILVAMKAFEERGSRIKD